MKIHNFEQGSQEWLQARAGKLTGSDFHYYFGNSEKKKTMLRIKAGERVTGQLSDKEIFSNKSMERGNEQEQSAIDTYSFESGNEVNQVGFCELSESVGCSPDGLVGDDGIIEIKSQDFNQFIKLLQDQKPCPIYNTQIQFNLYVTDRKWCDFISYNPKFIQKPIQILRVMRNEEDIERIKTTIKIIDQEINNIINLIKQK